MAKLFANSGDPDQTPHLRRLTWVCTVCQLPFYGSSEYNGLRGMDAFLLDSFHVCVGLQVLTTTLISIGA